MRRNSLAPALLGAALLCLGAPAAADESCGTCHPAEKVALQKSIHARESVSCTSCHGGDPRALDVEPAHRGDFRTLEDRLGIPASCAECHSDLERMRPYNLPVDQYALYQTSEHGRGLAAGNEEVAVCTDCHRAHDILEPQNPASPVHFRRIAATCDQCHGDPELTARYDLDPGVVDDYRASIHGRTLLEEGSTAAPDCTSCHGVHGATPPGFGDLDKICGSCHTLARRAFLEGPHYEAMLAAEMPECASCHSHHSIVQFGISDIEDLCVSCHAEGSDPVHLGRIIHTSITNAEAEVDQAEDLIQVGSRMAVDVEDHLARIEEARSYLTEVLPLVHAVSREPVESLTRRARSIGEEVQHELHESMDRRPMRIGLAVLWFYVVMTLVVIIGFKRRLLSEGSTS